MTGGASGVPDPGVGGTRLVLVGAEAWLWLRGLLGASGRGLGRSLGLKEPWCSPPGNGAPATDRKGCLRSHGVAQCGPHHRNSISTGVSLLSPHSAATIPTGPKMK